MELIITYVLINIVLSRFLERKKWSAAIIAHAVLFVVLFMALFALGPDETTVLISQKIIGESAFESLQEAIGDIGGNTVIFAPMLVIETVMILTGIIAAVIVTKRVIDAVNSRTSNYARHVDAEDEKVCFRDPTKERSRRYKLFLKNCVMLC